MNKTILLIISLLCATAFPTSYFLYTHLNQQPEQQTLITIAPFDSNLIQHIARTRKNRIATEDISAIYERVYQLCKVLTIAEYKQELFSTIMLSNDVYNNARRSIFSSSDRHLPFMQYVRILDRMITLLKRRDESELIKKLQFIRTTIIQQNEYRKEKRVLAGKKKSSPFELLKFTFGIIKLI